MDSLSNGEVSDKCLDNAILNSGDVAESKSKSVTNEDLASLSAEIGASNSEVLGNNSTSEPTKPEKECTKQDKILSENSPEPKPTVESNNETTKPIIAKENGIPDTGNLDESENASGISTKDGIKDSELQETDGVPSPTKSDDVALIQEKYCPSNCVTLGDDKNDLETTLPSNIVVSDKENSPNEEKELEAVLPSSIAFVDEQNSSGEKHDLETTLPSNTVALNKEHSSSVENDAETTLASSEDKCHDDTDIIDTSDCSIISSNKCSNMNNTSSPKDECKLIPGAEVKVAKNHFMAGGSIVSSKDSESDKQKLNSVHNSKVVDADQIMDFSKKILENCGSSDVNKLKNCDEQLVNHETSKKTEQSTEVKLVESNKSDSESQKLLDTSLNIQDNNANEINSHEKLEENLTSDPDANPMENDAIKSKASSPDIQSSDSHLICDKENKSEDSSPPAEKQSKESSDSFVFADLTNEETGFPEVFTGLVKIGKYISVKGDFTLRSSEALVESPSLIAPYLLKEPDSFPSKDKVSQSEVKEKDFFHSTAGEILIGIGLSRVNEWFHKDMVRIKKRQLKRKKTPELEEDLTMHEKFYSEAKKANSVYSFEFTECKTCGFTTESSVVMEGHLLVPHITQRREYQCNFCDVINRDPKGMLLHMQDVHRKIGRIQPPVLFFECPYCTFESNSKVKLNHHLLKCQRVYDQGINQAPAKDFEYPALTPKPITVAVVKAYEKSLGSMHRGRGRPKKELVDSMLVNKFPSSSNLPSLTPGHPPFKGSSGSPLADSLMQNQLMSSGQLPNMLRPAHAGAMGQLRPGMPGMHMQSPNRFFGVNPNGQLVPLMGNNHLVTSPSQFPFSSNLDNSGGKKSSSSPQFYNKMFDMSQRQPNSKGMSSVTITPLPKLTGPYPVPMAKPSTASGSNQMSSNSLVVCEICDGYIKDLEQLRTHMQLIHKVKIHPKMLVSRPPLNCQKCQWRFFTDQGLERHLLGAHGLVTSNMQELANKGKDAGCCTICGRVYASKLVSHMNQVHKITLKPAHLSYKCTVCSATFNLYRLFENHVYLVHSGAGKRSADGRSSPSKKLKALSGSSTDGESLNHKEKKLPADIGDENAKKCKQCSSDMSQDKNSQSDMCEKCLKSDELVEGTESAKTLRDELKEKDKAIEKAAV